MEAPLTPLASVKSEAVTPKTFSLNVTVKWTLLALVGFASALTIELTVGTAIL